MSDDTNRNTETANRSLTHSLTHSQSLTHSHSHSAANAQRMQSLTLSLSVTVTGQSHSQRESVESVESVPPFASIFHISSHHNFHFYCALLDTIQILLSYYCIAFSARSRPAAPAGARPPPDRRMYVSITTILHFTAHIFAGKPCNVICRYYTNPTVLSTVA